MINQQKFIKYKIHATQLKLKKEVRRYFDFFKKIINVERRKIENEIKEGKGIITREKNKIYLIDE